MKNIDIEAVAPEGAAELAVEAMDEYQRGEIGRKTFRFVKSCMRDPVLRERIRARAAELRGEAEAAQARSDCVCTDNPSVSFAASSLYTREPLPGGGSR